MPLLDMEPGNNPGAFGTLTFGKEGSPAAFTVDTDGNMTVGGSAYAPRRTATVALLGDSFTALNAPPSGYSSAGAYWFPANGWWDWADLLLGKRTQRGGTFGVGGNTTAQILARVGDVIAAAPAYCVVQGGTNDINLGVDPLVTIANQTATIAALINAGITPILTTIPPNPYTTTTQLNSLYTILKWQKTVPFTIKGVILCDWRPYCADPATGQWLAGLSDDTIHPNSVGCRNMGKALYDTLSGVFRAFDSLCTSNADKGLVNLNPMMQGTAGVPNTGVTGTVPTGFSADAWNGDSTVTAVSSLVQLNALDNFNWWKAVISGGSLQMRWQSTGWAAGDNVYAECQFMFDTTQPFSNIDKCNLRIDAVAGASGNAQDLNAPTSDLANHWAASWIGGVCRTPIFPIPAGTTALSTKFVVQRIAGTTPAATVLISRMALRKATSATVY